MERTGDQRGQEPCSVTQPESRVEIAVDVLTSGLLSVWEAAARDYRASHWSEEFPNLDSVLEVGWLRR